jgi:hypothetical protein
MLRRCPTVTTPFSRCSRSPGPGPQTRLSITSSNGTAGGSSTLETSMQEKGNLNPEGIQSGYISDNSGKSSKQRDGRSSATVPQASTNTSSAARPRPQQHNLHKQGHRDPQEQPRRSPPRKGHRVARNELAPLSADE